MKDGKSKIHFPSSDLKVVKGKLNSQPSRHDVYTIMENIMEAIFYILPQKKKIALVIFFPGAAFKFPGRFTLRPCVF